MLLLSNGIAFVAAAFLLLEWRAIGERFLLSFALGFLCIVVGCSISTLRDSGSFVVGIWLANSMVPLAHLFFLHGAALFSGTRLSPKWLTLPVLCSALMGLPWPPEHRDQIMSFLSAGAVALLTLRTARMLVAARHADCSQTRMLFWTFLVHGSFYAVKALCAFAPGAFVRLSNYAGMMITLSLFEGILVEVALAMSIAGALRRRREEVANRLAESDPLTGLLNRRGFEARAADILSGARRGALLLIDVDHFKAINDGFGHAEGDRLLVTLADFLRTHTPGTTVTARLGGDEFALLLPGFDEHSALEIGQALCAGFARTAASGAGGTLSIGCAAFTTISRDLAQILARADVGLYEAKSLGRNRAAASPRIPDIDRAPSAVVLPFAANG